VLMRDFAADAALIEMVSCDALEAVHALTRENWCVIAIAPPEQYRSGCERLCATACVSREASLQHTCELIHKSVRRRVSRARATGNWLLPIPSAASATIAPSSAGISLLTERERQIVQLLDLGRTNVAIALDLGIKLSTVKNHVHNILQKLGVANRGEACALMRIALGSHSTKSRG